MATTTNYSWTTPDDTDLVKDGASAIRTLGSAIDTTVFNNAGAAVAKSLIDAEGDLIVGDAADAVQRLAVGSNGNVLTVDTAVDGKIKWAAPAGGGKVLQVVSSSYSTSTTTTSTAFVDTGLTATITPSSATSKILVLVSQNGVVKESGNAAAQVNLQLLRGATQIGFISAMGYENSSKPLYLSTAGFSYLDSPNTTSATTYKTQFRNDVATSITVQVSSSTSQITLLEIGA